MTTGQPAALHPRQRVKFVGHHGTTEGPTGRIWRITKNGVWVTLDNSHRECWHPDDITPAPRQM